MDYHQRIAITLGFLLLPIATAYAGGCTGEYQPHEKGDFRFKTASSFEEGNSLHIYRTCVLNEDPQNDLKVSWYIPGPHLTWLPPHERIDFSRRSIDPDARPLKGCIEYGHLGDVTIAEFLGDKAEEALTAEPNEQACRQQAGLQVLPGGKKEIDPPKFGWTEDYTIFFPSDIEDVRETMLKLSATVSIKETDDGAYRTYFVYSVAPYDGRKGGDPEAVRFRAIFPDAIPYLQELYAAQVAAEPRVLGFKGESAFTISRAEKYRPAPMLLEFLGKENQILAVLQVTVLAPGL
ncbi:hypothetical protein J2Z31_003600 [Sinorhizobium kostiense]|uniref:Lipoprotein n=1 Tax=Sinorhizobium kostiense TaxID=76747 RepID=A0ABS4R3V5_9HYPH|nr:hypothetical protein [Sinorhizobium kostiense]MBP2237086.1 hypothetical protein [Sinorhizobium kostiense]